jgi:Flp pilus assembly protein TadG
MRFGSRNGQAIILVVVAASLILIGALGFAIDGGQVYAQRQMAQAAADAAAEAGIMSILRGTNATSTHTFGTGVAPIQSSTCTTSDGRTPCVYARNNGFGGTSSDTVTLSYPSSVTGVTLASVTVPAFEVTVQRTVNTGFIQFLKGPSSTTISAKSIAGIVGTVSPDSIIVLGSGANAFTAANGASVSVSGGGIQVDSSNSSAVSLSGGATVTAGSFGIVGSDSITNGASANPTPTTGVSTVPDPFASLASPTVGSCSFTNYSLGGGATQTLNPGTYCGGITVANGATATYNPGMYIINGGGLNLAGGTTNTGTGVTFYLTGTNSTYSSVSISNGVSATFSAPTTGTYTGILFYQDRTIVTSSNATFSGGSSMTLTGSLYFPTTSVSFSNGSGSAGYTAIVASKVSFTGGTSIKYDSTGKKTGLFQSGVTLLQ